MSDDIKNQIEQAKQEYNKHMVSVRKSEEKLKKEINEYKKRAEKDLSDEIQRRYAKMKISTTHAHRWASDFFEKEKDNILRPRKTINRYDKFYASDEDCVTDYYYKVLGVTRDSSKQDIIKAFRAKCLIYHPDRASDDFNKREQEDMFKIINRAHRLLTLKENENFKKKYDDEGNWDGWVQTQTMKSSYASSEYNPYILARSFGRAGPCLFEVRIL